MFHRTALSVWGPWFDSSSGYGNDTMMAQTKASRPNPCNQLPTQNKQSTEYIDEQHKYWNIKSELFSKQMQNNHQLDTHRSTLLASISSQSLKAREITAAPPTNARIVPSTRSNQSGMNLLPVLASVGSISKSGRRGTLYPTGDAWS